jgi:hypothetical protein
MAASKPEKETWLNNANQPFTRHFFDAISSVQLLAAKDSHFFSFKNIYEILTTYFQFIMHSTLH